MYRMLHHSHPSHKLHPSHKSHPCQYPLLLRRALPMDSLRPPSSRKTFRFFVIFRLLYYFRKHNRTAPKTMLNKTMRHEKNPDSHWDYYIFHNSFQFVDIARTNDTGNNIVGRRFHIRRRRAMPAPFRRQSHNRHICRCPGCLFYGNWNKVGFGARCIHARLFTDQYNNRIRCEKP